MEFDFADCKSQQPIAAIEVKLQSMGFTIRHELNRSLEGRSFMVSFISALTQSGIDYEQLRGGGIYVDLQEGKGRDTMLAQVAAYCSANNLEYKQQEGR
jgi:DNA-dependent RNA polymerase auxiliary subunit epsilon